MPFWRKLFDAFLMFGLTLLLRVLVPRRVLIFVCLGALLLAVVLLFVKRKLLLTEPAFILLFSLIMVVLLQNRYAFPGDPFTPFWLPALCGALALGTVSCVLIYRRVGVVWSLLLPILLIVLIIGFFGISLLLENLNYALDFSDPEVLYTRVESKEIDRHRRLPDTYYLTLRVEGALIEWRSAQKCMMILSAAMCSHLPIAAESSASRFILPNDRKDPRRAIYPSGIFF